MPEPETTRSLNDPITGGLRVSAWAAGRFPSAIDETGDLTGPRAGNSFWSSRLILASGLSTSSSGGTLLLRVGLARCQPLLDHSIRSLGGGQFGLRWLRRNRLLINIRCLW